ncbi:unnamed protein product, partial [Prorocentrum cordatum]
MFRNRRVVAVAEKEASPRAEVAMTISVEELRLLLRSDVEEVIRAELSAASVVLGPAGRRSAGLGRQRSRGDSDSSPPVSGRRAPGSDAGPLMPMEVGMSRSNAESSTFLQRWGPGNDSPAMYELLAHEPEDTLESQASTVLPNMGWCTTRVVRCVSSLWSLQEPPRTWCLARFVRSSQFQTFFALAIGVNAAFMVYSVNRDMTSVSRPDGNTPPWMSYADVCFLSLYCVELVCKLAVHRLFYFWNEDMAWNWLDFLLIAQSLVDAMSASSARGGGNTWMRTIRLFRVAKVLRILRFVKVFTQLHLIMSAILGSLLHLFWSMMVFAILFLMFSLYFVSSVAAYLKSTEGRDKHVAEPLLQYFGSVQGSMTTLFMALSGGADWG